MKLRGEVIAVETTGDTLKVTLRIGETAAASWRRMTMTTVHVSDIARNRRTFHVGRRIDVSLEARP